MRILFSYLITSSVGSKLVIDNAAHDMLGGVHSHICISAVPIQANKHLIIFVGDWSFKIV